MKNNAPKIEYEDTGFEDSEYSRYNKYTKSTTIGKQQLCTHI